MSHTDSSDTTAYRIGSYESNAMKSANPHSGIYKTDVSATLDTSGGNPACNQGGTIIVSDCHDTCKDVTIINTNITDGRYEDSDGVVQTITARAGTGGGNLPIVVEEQYAYSTDTFVKTTKPHNIDEVPTIVESGISPTLTAFDSAPSRTNVYVVQDVSDVKPPITIGNGQVDQLYEQPIAGTLNCMHEQQIVIHDIAAVDCMNSTENPNVNGTLQAHGSGGWSANTNNVVRVKSVVRRLTPLEAERLQGFPDQWTEGESDSARYKALGNSVAVPCVAYIMSGIADLLDSQAGETDEID